MVNFSEIADLLKTPAKSGKLGSARKFGSAKKKTGGVVKGKDKGRASKHIEVGLHPPEAFGLHTMWWFLC